MVSPVQNSNDIASLVFLYREYYFTICLIIFELVSLENRSLPYYRSLINWSLIYSICSTFISLYYYLTLSLISLVFLFLF